jgi:two-component system, LytTR family, sensor kinase
LNSERSILPVYWIIYYLLISLVEAGPEQHYYQAFLPNLISLPVKYVFVAVTIGPLLNLLLLKKRITTFLFLYFLLLFIFAVLLRVADNYIILPYVLTDWIKQPLFNSPSLLYSVIKLQFVAAIPFMIRLFYSWAETESRNSRQLQQQAEAELSLLRSQFHPHFLFNALNTLYSKIITDPPQASEIVLKICSLLRFSLYETRGSRIEISREIEYLASYMALQKIRFGDMINISFSTFGDTARKKVEPFLILPIIENGFKYCQPDNDGKAWVTVQISITDDHVTAQVDNSTRSESLKRADDRKGLGQFNVRRRLSLLFPGNHVMTCEQGEENYYVYLKFPLMADGG